MTAKSENSKDETTKMNADTRGIRELAEKWRTENVYKLREGVKVWPLTADEFDDYLTAFAESIVEQERDAIIELIEAFVNDCNDGKWQPKKLIEAIRSRWQRGEQ